MPNYVKNVVRVHGPDDEIRAFEAASFSPVRSSLNPEAPPQPQIRFARIIPEPPSLCAESSNLITDGVVALVLEAQHRDNQFCDGVSGLSDEIRWNPGVHRDLAARLARLDPNWRDLARKGLRSIVDTGHVSWYSWRCSHWGTKWEPSGFLREGLGRMEFDTAWDVPVPIYERIVERWPRLAIRVAAFDEGWNFAGEGWFVGAQYEHEGEGDPPEFTTWKPEESDPRTRRVHRECYRMNIEEAFA